MSTGSPIHNSEMVLDALVFAIQKHDGQFRKGGQIPYITHPIAVSYIVAQYKGSSRLAELVTAAILHDVLEDTQTTLQELAERFTYLVASIVYELTSDPVEIARMGKFEYLKNKMLHMSSYAFTIKLADRLHNVSDKPTKKMVDDTLATMDYLYATRKRITVPQRRLMEKIIQACLKKKEH